MGITSCDRYEKEGSCVSGPEAARAGATFRRIINIQRGKSGRERGPDDGILLNSWRVSDWGARRLLAAHLVLPYKEEKGKRKNNFSPITPITNGRSVTVIT